MPQAATETDTAIIRSHHSNGLIIHLRQALHDRNDGPSTCGAACPVSCSNGGRRGLEAPLRGRLLYNNCMRAHCALLVFLLASNAPARMVSAGVTARPGKPLPPGLKAPPVNFRDIAREAGITAVNVLGDDKQKSYIVEMTGNGVALIDFDNDGLLDILFVTADRLQPTAPPPCICITTWAA